MTSYNAIRYCDKTVSKPLPRNPYLMDTMQRIESVRNVAAFLVGILASMPAYVAEEPLTCVVRGTGIVLEEIDILRRVLVRSQRARALRY